MDKTILVSSYATAIKQRNTFFVLLIVITISLLGITLKLLTLEQRVVLVPGLNQEVWTSNSGVSASYLEETAAMFLPLLLDLTSDSIDWKKERALSHVSQSDPSYIKALSDYFADAKEKYKKFSLSTHFGIKSFEVDSKKMLVKANGTLISHFGERGYEGTECTYILQFEWTSGKLLLTSFTKEIPQNQDEMNNAQN